MSAPNEIEKFVRNRLKVLREQSELTQAEIAEMAGISYGYYQNIEHGIRPNVSIRMLDKLAHAYGLSVHQLLAPTIPNFKLQSKPIPPPHREKRKRSN